MLHFDKEGNANSVRPRWHQQYFATGKCNSRKLQKILISSSFRGKVPSPTGPLFLNFCRSRGTSLQNFVNFSAEVGQLLCRSFSGSPGVMEINTFADRKNTPPRFDNLGGDFCVFGRLAGDVFPLLPAIVSLHRDASPPGHRR